MRNFIDLLGAGAGRELEACLIKMYFHFNLFQRHVCLYVYIARGWIGGFGLGGGNKKCWSFFPQVPGFFCSQFRGVRFLADHNLIR